MDNQLQNQFEQAAADVQELSKRPGNEDLLELYSLFKAGTEGPVNGKRPGPLKMVARAKYDAWAQLDEVSKEEAMKRYISKVASMVQHDG